MGQDPAAEQRCQGGGESDQRHNGGENPVNALGRIIVSHHRLPGHGSSTNARRLNKTQYQQHRGTLHPQHTQAANGKNGQPDEQNGTPSEAIRQRSPDELGQSEAGQK